MWIMAPKKQKPYWTAARVKELIDAMPAPSSGAKLAATIGVTRALVSHWIVGVRVPSPIHVFALDCLARQYGVPPSPQKSTE